MAVSSVDESPWWVDNTRIFERLDWRVIFPKVQPVELDLGAGDGGFVLEMARRHPDRNFLAVERLLGRARKIVKRAEQEHLTHLRVLRMETSYFIRYLCPPASVQRVYILFPDPWPKRRHFPHRLIQPEFLRDLRAVLTAEGEVRFTTDHQDYAQWALKHWQQARGWQPAELWDVAADPLTDFQRTFIQEGRVFYRQCWRAASEAVD